MRNKTVLWILPALATSVFLFQEANGAEAVKRTHFTMDISPEWGRSGGVITIDLDRDGARDFLCTQPEMMAAYGQNGSQMWKRTSTRQQLGGQSESDGLPGLHGPGMQAGDIDGDETPEVLYITRDNQLIVLDGPSGELETEIALPEVDSHYDRWEHAVIANFRGAGDRDLLLQASVDIREGEGVYLRDTVIAAYEFAALKKHGDQTMAMWQRDDFISVSHGVGKVIDLDRDGRDEVVGGMAIGAEGELLVRSGVRNRSSPHIDSIAIGDIDPDIPGLEIVVPEEGGRKRVILFNKMEVLWQRAQEGFTDGDKVQIGDFDPTQKGLEIFLRGADADDMRVYNKDGELLTHYQFDEVKQPASWTDGGIEDIFRIRWTGGRKEYVAAKERHETGTAGIMDPMTARFMEVFDHAVDRIYVTDIRGDWREELVVIAGNELFIYENQAPNSNPNHPTLWDDPTYRRLKMTWNYYSP